MTAADRDTLLTLVQQWREEAARYDTVHSAFLRGGIGMLKVCADELTALLARLTPPEPETP